MTRLVAGALVAVSFAPAAAAPPVTIVARPSLVPSPSTAVTLFGFVSSAKAGEDIAIQAKDCGSENFRVVAGAVTRANGGWTTDANYFPRISTRLRALWRDETAEVAIRVRAGINLWKLSARRFRVIGFGGNSGRPFRGKRVDFQRFDRRLGSWNTVRRVVLTEEGRGTGMQAEFTTSLRNGTRVRALLPASQVRPCFLPGVSMISEVGP